MLAFTLMGSDKRVLHECWKLKAFLGYGAFWPHYHSYWADVTILVSQKGTSHELCTHIHISRHAKSNTRLISNLHWKPLNAVYFQLYAPFNTHTVCAYKFHSMFENCKY